MTTLRKSIELMGQAQNSEKLEAQIDDAEVWFDRGNELFELGRYEEAIASYDRAIEINPDDHQFWYERGNALRQLERYPEVIASYDKAIEIEPDLYEAWLSRGGALRQLERYPEAIASYDRAIEIKPDLYEALEPPIFSVRCGRWTKSPMLGLRSTFTNNF